MKIRAWFQKAAAKIAALEFLAYGLFGWMAHINPICLPALIIAWNPWISLAAIIAISVFFKLTAKIAALGIAKIFFDEEDPQKVQEKMGEVTIATFLYRNIEWIQVGLTALGVSTLKYFDFFGVTNREPIIFLILWIVTIFETAPVIFIGDRKKIDITTMEGRRRLFNALYEISPFPVRVLMIILELGYGAWLVFWDGPEYFFLFFRKPKKRWPFWGEVILYIAATGIQMAVWTKIYILGYESVSELVKHYWK